jgi:RNA methyltransferase, TrmH family
MPDVISSHSNPLVKQIRSLKQKKNRDESGLFLVEGIHHVGEAIEAGWTPELLVYAPGLLSSDFASRLIESQREKGIQSTAFAADIFTDLTEKENPQGILAIFKQRKLDIKDLESNHIETGAALVNPQDPGNVGTILRTLDATEGNILFLLDGGVELYHPSLVRASMGTIFHIPVVQATFGEFILWARNRGLTVIGTSAHAKMDYHKIKEVKKPAILLLGSEQKGLSAEQMEKCTVNVSIPMKGHASSLNLAVAAGILLYALSD